MKDVLGEVKWGLPGVTTYGNTGANIMVRKLKKCGVGRIAVRT